MIRVTNPVGKFRAIFRERHLQRKVSKSKQMLSRVRRSHQSCEHSHRRIDRDWLTPNGVRPKNSYSSLDFRSSKFQNPSGISKGEPFVTHLRLEALAKARRERERAQEPLLSLSLSLSLSLPFEESDDFWRRLRLSPTRRALCAGLVTSVVLFGMCVSKGKTNLAHFFGERRLLGLVTRLDQILGMFFRNFEMDGRHWL